MTHAKKLGKIVEIFLYYWEEYLSKNPTRLTEKINVKKMLICRTPFLGQHKYECPDCGYSINVPHSCKSRFCSVCGYTATEAWIAIRFNTILNCGYQHVVVTIPKRLRWMLKINRIVTLNMFSRLVAELSLIHI